MAQCQPAFVQFLKWSDIYNEEKPFQILIERGLDNGNQRNTNLEWEEKQIYVRDFRGDQDFFDIDEHGFTTRAMAGYSQLESREEIEKHYLPAVERLLRQAIDGVGTVFIFDWRIRDSQTHYPSGAVDFGDQHNPLLPSNFAHVDMAPISIVHRIQRSFPQSADEIFTQRIRAINVWKPLNNCVEQWPLALCDGNTIPSETLVETDSVRRENIAALYYATYAQEQKWHYLHCQTPEEVLVFKHFDTKLDVKASFAMHSSVRLDESPSNAQPRRSIEVRALLFERVFQLPVLEQEEERSRTT